jgi:hypothetical protein
MISPLSLPSTSVRVGFSFVFDMARRYLLDFSLSDCDFSLLFLVRIFKIKRVFNPKSLA